MCAERGPIDFAGGVASSAGGPGHISWAPAVPAAYVIQAAARLRVAAPVAVFPSWGPGHLSPAVGPLMGLAGRGTLAAAPPLGFEILPQTVSAMI